MAILVQDLKFFQSERMTDEDDGGGRMAAVEIVSGNENSIFDDISDVDRAAGGVSLRKVYAQVASDSADKYLDSGVVLFKPPTDPDVSVTVMSTGDFYDERLALRERLESAISRGARMQAYLWGAHGPGQRSVTLWGRPSAKIPGVGERLDLAEYDSGEEQHSQIVWPTRITVTEMTFYAEQGGKVVSYQVNQIVVEIAEGLRHAFTGTEPNLTDETDPPSKVFETRYNTGALPLFGAAPLTEAAAPAERSVKIGSLYTPLIPTAFAETALPDVTPGADSGALSPANANNITWTTTANFVGDGLSLFIPSGVYPGTLTISTTAGGIIDDGGSLVLNGAHIGRIDYSNGVCNFNDGSPSLGTTSKTLSYKPAAAPKRIADTATLAVTPGNRGFVWVITLVPIPAPGSLRVSYRVNNEWYSLFDNGAGKLSGIDSSYGSGTVSFTTGTATITTGELPDADSEILFDWSTTVNYTAGGGLPVNPPRAEFALSHAGIAPGSVTVSSSALSVSLTDDGIGNLTGTGAFGRIRYATGEGWIQPNNVPPKAAEFSLTYDYGEPIEDVFEMPAREPDATLRLTLSQVPRVGSVEVEWHTLILDYEPETVEIERPRPVDPKHICSDNGSGGFDVPGGVPGTIDYSGRIVQWLPDVELPIPHATWRDELVGTGVNDEGVPVDIYRRLFNGWEYIPSGAFFPIDETGVAKIRYRLASGDTSNTETFTVDTLTFDVTKGYGEYITSASLQFTLGSSRYNDIAGLIYRDKSPLTGAGTLAGSMNPSTGVVTLTDWPSGGANAVFIESLVTEVGGQPVDFVVFRTPISPIKVGTLQLRFGDTEGNTYSKTPDSSGILEDNDCAITVDFTRGIVKARFGSWRAVSGLTLEEQAEPWAAPGLAVDVDGTSSVWQPKMVNAGTIVYNAVASTSLPPDSTLLGLDAARLPPDGKALIFQTGMLALVHHTDTLAVATLSPTQGIDTGRTRLYRVSITDTDGKVLGADQYNVNRATGLVTMGASLDTSGYTAPWTVHHTVADLLRVIDTDINGSLSFMSSLTHNYPANESLCSGVLFAGTLQARVSNLFAQSAWDNVWADSLRGTAPLADYNDALYPIVVKNAGAYPDRILVRFTSGTAFQVIGENLGFIAVGDINTDCEPVNSLTGEPYFKIDYRGWGSGWATGNCLRFNLHGAAYPVDLVRAIQPSSPGTGTDCFELLLIGNIDSAS